MRDVEIGCGNDNDKMMIVNDIEMRMLMICVHCDEYDTVLCLQYNDNDDDVCSS